MQAYLYWLESLDHRHIPQAQDIDSLAIMWDGESVFCGGVVTSTVPCSFISPWQSSEECLTVVPGIIGSALSNLTLKESNPLVDTSIHFSLKSPREPTYHTLQRFVQN